MSYQRYLDRAAVKTNPADNGTAYSRWVGLKRLFEDLRIAHGLDHAWDLVLNRRAKTRFGACAHRTQEVEISASYVEKGLWADICDTLRHEVAHALVGRGNGHNNVWRWKCLEVGARPQRCRADTNNALPEAKYAGTCSKCPGKVWQRHRMTRRTANGACPKHGIKIEWTQRF